MALRLLIKGSPANARREASRRGIPLKNVKKHPRFNEVYADASCKALTKAMIWHGDTPHKPKSGRGFPPGSLVYFNAAGCRSGEMGGASRRRRRR
jgi:hypothetical protein